MSPAAHRVVPLRPAGRPDIVVLRALGLGDLLTGIPALRGLRRAHPDAHITLAAPERFCQLAMLSGAIDEIDPTPGLGRLHPRRRNPDVAVNLHGSGPESIADLLGLKPKTLLTHRHSDYPELQGPPWRADLHEVDRWCGMLEWHGIPCNPDDLAIPRPHGYPDRSGVVVIHPGAAAAARRWPADRFAAVAAQLRRAGHDVVITGDCNELELARSVAHQAGLPESSVLAGTLGLLGLVALISDCRLLVCGDTGAGHVATATGTPSVVLFGPTPPSRWGPRGNGPHIAIWAGDKGDPHAAEPHSGLLLITASRVIEAVDSLLRVPTCQ
ncbi:glycosyltransferase family 9 protein [Mycolicibacterium mageritense]|uniref:Lipopolysaccharide core heptosyltransferase RfaQ n=1 Tax=Mycolicibacterium mageritense TaxID=53462 RepID=A0AAI8TWP4_MYCME|nr:glycosyltransferase family 9 protein [Mycolicibacterium mageritense]BDY30315.1 Lipopolysaccharide core heptosyltransferase RfaQ [Mycolicibacterium mageritense]